MWWALGLVALYVMHRVSAPTPPAAATPTIARETADQSKAWEEQSMTADGVNPFWAGDGGPADPFILKLPAVTTASQGGSGAGGGGTGSGGGGTGGAGGGGGRLK